MGAEVASWEDKVGSTSCSLTSQPPEHSRTWPRRWGRPPGSAWQTRLTPAGGLLPNCGCWETGVRPEAGQGSCEAMCRSARGPAVHPPSMLLAESPRGGKWTWKLRVIWSGRPQSGTSRFLSPPCPPLLRVSWDENSGSSLTAQRG